MNPKIDRDNLQLIHKITKKLSMPDCFRNSQKWQTQNQKKTKRMGRGLQETHGQPWGKD